MKSSRFAAFLAVLLTLVLGACGQSITHTLSVSMPPVKAVPCAPAPGAGVMGVCTPRPKFGVTPFKLSGTLVPDVSEYQGCALYSEAIFRIYEAGTNRQDARAGCHAAELRRLHAWSAAYFFARPPGYFHAPSCAGQVTRVVSILSSLGGLVGPVIIDAEVRLPVGFVTCLAHGLEHAHLAVVTYTAPGTWPGGKFVTRVWVAAYPNRPPCFSNACPYVAHQFADSFSCRGVIGDCSIAEGILSIRQHAAQSSKRVLDHDYRLRKTLRADLTRHNCRVGPAKPGSYRRACRHWLLEGAQVNRQIRALHARHIY
jgi:hypothetical protein